jgi:hypothetical protein
MRKRVALLAILLLFTPYIQGCAGNNPPPTQVAGIADVAGKIEASANVVLHAAQSASSAVVPSTGKTLITRDQLDQVAIQVNKLGRLGITLRHALDDYNTAKAAGKDLTAQKQLITQVLADLTTALNVVGTAIPKGTIQQIDQEVTSILSLIIQLRGSYNLS